MECQLLKQLELELLQPLVRANRARLEQLLADDFKEVGASGLTFGKEVVLAHLPDEGDKTFETTNMQAKLLAPTVGLVTYGCTRHYQGITTYSKRSSVWLKKGSHWQMVYHQGTPCESF